MRTIFFLLLPALLCAQPCPQLWNDYLRQTDAPARLTALDAYIGGPCSDSLAAAHLYKGLILLQQNDFENARSNFRRVTELAPKNANGWYQLGMSIYLADPMNTEILSALNQSITLDPLAWKPLMLRGDYALYFSQYENAMADYRKSLELMGDRNLTDKKTSLAALGGTLVDFSAMQAEVSTQNTMLEEALTHLNASLALDSSFAIPYDLLGVAYFKLQKYPESAAAFERCAHFNPNYEHIRTKEALAFREAGKYYGERENNLEKAKQYLQQSYDLNPSDTETIRLLGVAAGFGGDHEAAIRWFKMAVELEPVNAQFWWYLGNAYGAGGNNKEMKACRKKAKGIDPDVESKL